MSDLDLGPRDPEGYYIVKIPRSLLDKVVRRYSDKIMIVEVGDEVLVRTKSRRIALHILRIIGGK